MPLTTVSSLSKTRAALPSSSKFPISVWCSSCQSPRGFSVTTFLNPASHFWSHIPQSRALLNLSHLLQKCFKTKYICLFKWSDKDQYPLLKSSTSMRPNEVLSRYIINPVKADELILFIPPPPPLGMETYQESSRYSCCTVNLRCLHITNDSTGMKHLFLMNTHE